MNLRNPDVRREMIVSDSSRVFAATAAFLAVLKVKVELCSLTQQSHEGRLIPGEPLEACAFSGSTHCSVTNVKSFYSVCFYSVR